MPLKAYLKCLTFHFTHIDAVPTLAAIPTD